MQIFIMNISNNKVVSVHYVLQIDVNGEKVVADKSDLENPLQFLHGGGSLLPEFESNLEGLKKGDDFSFKIEATNGYGERDASAVIPIPIDSFKGENGEIDTEMVKQGNVLPMVDQEGNQMQAIVIEVNEDHVVMDFNHPLAGKELFFSGSVADVREATKEEIDHGHVHGSAGHQH